MWKLVGVYKNNYNTSCRLTNQEPLYEKVYIFLMQLCKVIKFTIIVLQALYIIDKHLTLINTFSIVYYCTCNTEQSYRLMLHGFIFYYSISPILSRKFLFPLIFVPSPPYSSISAPLPVIFVSSMHEPPFCITIFYILYIGE